LQIQYETEKKDKNIQLLTEQDLLQRAKIEQSEFVQKIILGGTILLVIILSLLYNGFRLKQRINKKLESQQKEIYEKNKSLQHLLDEKEWLLKEIHHRVKNNLQTVMSLLSSQSAYLQNDAALTAIQDSQHRVHAMSLIHQKLYNSDDVSNIDMPAYIRELIEYMRDCFNTGQRIRFEINIVPLELDVSQAVPLGLILNEAITNAIKYAFPNDREGIINILLEHILNNQYLLTISDNGVGMPVHSDEKRAGSLGLSLIKGLSEDLDGSFTLEHQNGTVLKILFVHDVTIKRIGTFTSNDTNAKIYS
jgi:two-component sensor histidine kinase